MLATEDDPPDRGQTTRWGIPPRTEMRPPATRLARAVLETGRGLAVVLLVLATGCGPESTTATITAIEPLAPDQGDVEVVTGDDGVVRAEHPAYGCIPLSDLVLITFDLAPDGNGRPRAGYIYPHGNGREGVHRSVAAGLSVGDRLPATYEVRGSYGILSGAAGPTTEIRIPELDARSRAAMARIGTPTRRACPGSPNTYWEDEEPE
jgi:hypothetical protein